MPNKNLIAGPLSMINLSDSPNTYGYVIMPMTCAQRCALLLGGNFFLLELQNFGTLRQPLMGF